jgi:voltage-gated potassium channel
VAMAIFLRLMGTAARKGVPVLLGALVVVVFAGAGVFAITQHIPFTTGLYWAITTASTVGYGDVTPHNASGRFVANAEMLTAIPLLGATFALMTGAAAAAGVRRMLSMKVEPPEGSFRLVVGSHPIVPVILDELVKADDTVVLVADVDPVRVREGVRAIQGDPTNEATIRRAHPERAEHALVVGTSDADVLVSTVLLRQLAPQLPLAALTSSGQISEALHALGVEQTVSSDQLIAHTLAKSLESPHAGDLLLELVDAEDHRLVELDVVTEQVGKRLSQVRSEDSRLLILGAVHGGHVTLGVADDPVLASGDRLLSAQPTAGDHAHAHRPARAST